MDFAGGRSWRSSWSFYRRKACKKKNCKFMSINVRQNEILYPRTHYHGLRRRLSKNTWSTKATLMNNLEKIITYWKASSCSQKKCKFVVLCKVSRNFHSFFPVWRTAVLGQTFQNPSKQLPNPRILQTIFHGKFKFSMKFSYFRL